MLHRWRLVAGLVSTFGLVITMAGGSPILASANGNGNGNNNTKTTICHRTASHSHPYVQITVDNSSVDGNTGNDNGKGDHYAEHKGPIGPVSEGEWGDIIPPVAGDPGHNGLNWTDAGRAIYDNKCRLANELWDSEIATTIVRSNGQALGSPKAGVSVYDTAIVTHYDSGIEPTGTVTYYFYNTIDATGASTSQVVNLDAGSVPNSSTHGPLAAGSYSFRAVYSGDSNYAQSTSGIEPLEILKADPGITTNQDPTSGLVGATIKDSASVTGGFNPTGTVTFVLKLNGSTVLTSEPIPLDAQGKAAFTSGYLANTAGTYYWIATYSGDPNNNDKTSGATDEPVVITETPPPPKKSVVVTTTVFDNSTEKALTGEETAGASVYDTAKVVPPSALPVPTGTVTYIYYTSGNCVAANALGADHLTVTLSAGKVPNSMTEGPLSAGSYSFRANYSGDANYLAGTSACEPFTINEGSAPTTPVIVTTPNPTQTTIGATLKDTANLSNGVNPTGKITFTLKNPSNVVVFTLDVTVNGNGNYSTPTGFVANVSGVWHWQAAYSGDANNNPVSSNYADEPVTVGPTGGVLAQTAMTLPAQGLAMGLLAFGLLAMLGALAWRRHEA